MDSPSFNVGLKGNVKPRSIFGFAVGKEIEVSWEVTNLDSQNFPGGILSIAMLPPNGQFVFFNYKIRSLKPHGRTIIEKNAEGKPLTTNVLAQGYTLFSAKMDNAVIQSPSGRIRNPQESFLSFFARSMEEIYEKWALIFAVIGLLGTFITSVIQLLFNLGILKPIP